MAYSEGGKLTQAGRRAQRVGKFTGCLTSDDPSQDDIHRHLILPVVSVPPLPARVVRFPSPMLTTTSSQALRLSTSNKRKSRAKKKFDLLGLPNEILLKVLDNLDVFDSAILALTCKRLAGVATSYSQLDWPPNTLRNYPSKPYEEGHFLKQRLGDRFFSKRLKYCRSCKHYVPRRKGFWQRKLGRKTWERPWRSLKMWDFKEWWASPKTQEMLTQWDKGNALHCPRCKLCKALLIPVV